MTMIEQAILALIGMIFFHIIDDYYLQGILASMKQKSWWQQNAPDKMYKNDYIMALIEHAFSWSCMIMIPVLLYVMVNYQTLIRVFTAIFINMIIHAIVDDLKANKKMINLVQDQLIHIIQIIVTWWFVVAKIY